MARYGYKADDAQRSAKVLERARLRPGDEAEYQKLHKRQKVAERRGEDCW